MNFSEFIEVGERIFNLQRIYNLKCGITKKDDALPDRILSLKREGLSSPEILPDIDTMIEEYYQIRGWDNQGVPSKLKISELGLEDLL